MLSYLGSIVFLISLFVPWIYYFSWWPYVLSDTSPVHTIFHSGHNGFYILLMGHFINTFEFIMMWILVIMLLLCPFFFYKNLKLINFIGFLSLICYIGIYTNLEPLATDTGYKILMGAYIGLIAIILFIIFNLFRLTKQILKPTPPNVESQ